MARMLLLLLLTALIFAYTSASQPLSLRFKSVCVKFLEKFSVLLFFIWWRLRKAPVYVGLTVPNCPCTACAAIYVVAATAAATLAAASIPLMRIISSKLAVILNEIVQ